MNTGFACAVVSVRDFVTNSVNRISRASFRLEPSFSTSYLGSWVACDVMMGSQLMRWSTLSNLKGHKRSSHVFSDARL